MTNGLTPDRIEFSFIRVGILGTISRAVVGAVTTPGGQLTLIALVRFSILVWF